MSLLGWDDEDEEDYEPAPALDAESARKVARSFYVLRMARYVALVVVLGVIALIVALGHAPAAVVWGVVALVVLMVVLAGVTAWRHRRAWGSSSGSPTA